VTPVASAKRRGCYIFATVERAISALTVTKREFFAIAIKTAGKTFRKKTTVNTEISTRERILHAAIQIATKDGIKSLTQPKVAKQAGVTQSLLTYYFPRKADLLTSVLEASHQDVRHAPPADIREALRFLEALMCDANRMRFFLAAVVEAGEAGELRKVLAEHAAAFTGQIAKIFGRPADDPDVVAFLDRLRGLGIRLLLEPKRRTGTKIDLAEIASEHGLI
jgi:AcrR family transcriptional regulator